METIMNLVKKLNAQTTIDLIIAILIIAIFDIILSPLFSYMILKLFNFKKNKKQIKENTFYRPIKVFFKITGAYVALLFLKSTFGLNEKFMDISTKIYKIIVTIMIANSLANSITRKSRVIKAIKEKSDKDINDSSTRILVRVIRALIYAIAGFIVFAEIGYDLSGLITGLGLGSVVLTIAAQDTIKNLIGGFLVIMDKPFKAGDFIKYSDYQGTVEDMTLRSTRIRTVDDTIVQIPNSVITSSSVENFSRIKRRRFIINLELIMDTSIEKVNILEEKLYSLLMKKENIYKDTISIHLTGISSNGLKLVIYCYFDTADYAEYLDLKEDLNKDIIEIIRREKIEMAYDTKTIELKK